MRMRRVPRHLQVKVIKWFDYLWFTQKSSDEEKSVGGLPGMIDSCEDRVQRDTEANMSVLSSAATAAPFSINMYRMSAAEAISLNSSLPPLLTNKGNEYKHQYLHCRLQWHTHTLFSDAYRCSCLSNSDIDRSSSSSQCKHFEGNDARHCQHSGRKR